MIILEYLLVGLIVGLALVYLAKAFWPKSKKTGCGCSNAHCKVPKPDLKIRA
jgi:hypothetical protein